MKINKNDILWFTIVISTIFLLSAIGMYFVYADINEDVLNQRILIDNLENENKKQQLLIDTLISERPIWEAKIKTAEDYLKAKEDTAKSARNDYNSALKENKCQDSIQACKAEVDKIKELKATVDAKDKEIQPAKNEVDKAKKELLDFEKRLKDARKKFDEIEKSIPTQQDRLTELVKESNRSTPNRISGSHQSIFISIILSDACLMGDTCPSYLELSKIYDNSNRFISGDFELRDTDVTKPIYGLVKCDGNCSSKYTLQKIGEEEVKIWRRHEPRLGYDTMEWYAYSNIPVISFVDPDDNTRSQSRQIIIEPSLPEGFDRTFSKSLAQNYTISFGKDRHIEGCTSATIGWKPFGDKLLKDTWDYFYKNCSTELKFNATSYKYFKPSYFNDCSTQCEYLKWVEDAKERARNYLIGKE